ncbi:hypothetical protein NKG05_16945 [Oerskovia sp. M15]
MALLTTARRPWRTVILPGAAVSAVVVALALAGGAARASWGLRDAGLARAPVGVRVRDPVQRPAAVRPAGARLDEPGHPHPRDPRPGTTATGRLLDVLLPVAVLAVAGTSWWAVRRRPEVRTDVFLLAVTALLLSLIVFNKVGSPQFVAWIGPPVAVAIALAGPGRARSGPLPPSPSWGPRASPSSSTRSPTGSSPSASRGWSRSRPCGTWLSWCCSSVRWSSSCGWASGPPECGVGDCRAHGRRTHGCRAPSSRQDPEPTANT